MSNAYLLIKIKARAKQGFRMAYMAVCGQKMRNISGISGISGENKKIFEDFVNFLDNCYACVVKFSASNCVFLVKT